MLLLAIIAPALLAVLVLGLPPGLARAAALVGSSASLGSLVAFGVTAAAGPNASAHTSGLALSSRIGADPLSLPLLLLSGILFTATAVYLLHVPERPRRHASLLLLAQTGVTGTFAARDLALLCGFLALSILATSLMLTPRDAPSREAGARLAAYTGVGVGALLVGLVGLFLVTGARTTSLPAITAQALPGGPAATLVLVAVLTGFGVLLQVLPVRWVADTYAAAPTEVRVLASGVLANVGGYGLLRVFCPLVPGGSAPWSEALAVAALAALAAGALVAIGQRTLEGVVSCAAICQMSFVLLAVAVAATAGAEVRQLATTGAVLQMVSHGLLVGGLFFLVGIIERHTGTTDLDDLGDLLGRAPASSVVLALLSFGAIAIPGVSGLAQLRILEAAARVAPAYAGIAIIAMAVLTGVCLRALAWVVLDAPGASSVGRSRPGPRELAVAAVLGGLAWLLPAASGPLARWIAEALPIGVGAA